MAALSKERPGRTQTISRFKMQLAASVKAYKGGAAVLHLASGYVKPAVAAAGLLSLGRFGETVDNSTGAAGAKSVEVIFHREFTVVWWDNDSGTPVTTADRGSACYWLDDHTVTADPTSASIAGRVFDVQGNFVLVETGHRVVAADAADSSIDDAGSYYTSTDVEGALQEVGTLAIKKLTATVGHADLTAAATSQSLNLGSALPANARILGVNVKLTTPFSGGTVSALVVDIGSSGDADALVDGANVFAAAVDGQASSVPAGIAPQKHFSTSTQLTALFAATGDNVVNLTAGACTLEVLYTILA